MVSIKLLAAVASLLIMLTSPTLAKIPHIPGVTLPARARGKGLLAALGNKLPAVAKAYGLSVEALTQEANRDNELMADTHGNLFHACSGADEDSTARHLLAEEHEHGHHHHHHHSHVRASSAGMKSHFNGLDVELDRHELSAANRRSLLGEPYYPATLDTVFTFHSKPGASKTIFLDFDGHTIPGSSRWAVSYNSGYPIVCASYNLLSDPDGTASFNQEELDGMVTIFKIVAEDFAPWDVDVTTQDPGPMASTGVRVIVGRCPEVAATCGCAGAAYLDSFDGNEPVLVFQRNPTSAGETASHEVGHSLGLYHDGQYSDVYYRGHGTFPHSWAPIMGVANSRGVSQWSMGEYIGATNLQDDIGRIQSRLTPTFDHGQDLASATPISSGGQGEVAVEAQGIVSTRWDTDYFQLHHAGGSIALSLVGTDVRSNLNAQLSIRDEYNNVLIQSLDSSPAEGSFIPATIFEAGTYYISVDGIGFGDPSLDGYSDYSSLGRYWMVVHFNETVPLNVPPTLPTPPPPTVSSTLPPPPPPVPSPVPPPVIQCNNNGVCEPWEKAATCASDCVFNNGNYLAGDNVCSIALGEDCSNSPGDCQQKKGGRGKFCCGSTVDCLSGKCGSNCYDETPVCGDGTCQLGIEDTETHWCQMDCGVMGP